MPNADNLKGKGFDSRTTNELREIARKGGKKSGESRRRTANFRKTLNAILEGEVYIADLAPFLESIGLDNTVESALCASLVAMGIKTGDPKYFEAIAKYSGQDQKEELDREEKKIKMDLAKKELNPESQDVEIIVDIEGGWQE